VEALPVDPFVKRGKRMTGYQRAASTLRLKTRNATPEQIDELREALGTSPAGDTFERRVPVTYDVTAS